LEVTFVASEHVMCDHIILTERNAIFLVLWFVIHVQDHEGNNCSKPLFKREII